ncbi:MAG TPA: hypothetical protein VEG38_09110 [Acidimicrobiia bacterium]|nr:hypothetical protein [Acidimicrobiia bacterium]
MHYHPETLLVLHRERHGRLEVEAARYAFLKSLRRHRRGRIWRGRRVRLKPAPVAVRPLLR